MDPGAWLEEGLRSIVGFLVPLVVVVVTLVGVLWGFQRRLVYLPSGPPPPVDRVLPGAREVTLTTADGLELAAWFLGAGPTGVVVLPGNAGNRAGRAPLARALADRGLSVLLVDYRGYGGNPGKPTAEGLLDDARAAADWLEAQPAIDGTVYLGESLGTGVAVALAVERPPAALVLRSPFPSLAAVARVHYGPVPDWLLRDRFPSAERIRRLETPVLVVAGTADRIIPPELSRELHAAAGSPKRLVEVEGAGHNDRALLDGRELIDAVTGFLRAHDLL